MLQCCTFVGINGHETVIKQHTPLAVVCAITVSMWRGHRMSRLLSLHSTHLCRRLDTGSWRCLRPSLSSSWVQNEGVGGRGTFLGITSGICSTSVARWWEKVMSISRFGQRFLWGPHIPEPLLICAGNAGHSTFNLRPNIFTDEFVLVLGND